MISTNATMKPGRIYTLTNPVNDEVFYVGSTTQSLTERLNVHIWNSPSSPHGNIGRYLSKSKIRPIIEEVECFENISNVDLRKEEMFWIRQFKAWGCPLINNNKSINDTDRRCLKLDAIELEYLKRMMKYVKLVCSKKGLKINYSTIHNVINRGRCVRRVYYNIKYLIKGLQEIEDSAI